MIEIPGGFQFDPQTELILRYGVVQSGAEFEPIYLNTHGGPQLVGIYNKPLDQIILKSGSTVDNTDSKYLDI